MGKLFTELEVIELLTKERERAIKIANDFQLKYQEQISLYDKTDQTQRYIAEQEQEVARKIEISIDGRTLGLEPKLQNQIKVDYKL